MNIIANFRTMVLGFECQDPQSTLYIIPIHWRQGITEDTDNIECSSRVTCMS